MRNLLVNPIQVTPSYQHSAGIDGIEGYCSIHRRTWPNNMEDLEEPNSYGSPTVIITVEANLALACPLEIENTPVVILNYTKEEYVPPLVLLEGMDGYKHPQLCLYMDSQMANTLEEVINKYRDELELVIKDLASITTRAGALAHMRELGKTHPVLTYGIDLPHDSYRNFLLDLTENSLNPTEEFDSRTYRL